MAKLAGATAGEFQLTTDGFQPYPAAVEQHLGGRVDFAQLVKTYSGEGLDSERRYSPPSIIASEKIVVQGTPDQGAFARPTSSARTSTCGCSSAGSPASRTRSAASGRT